MAALAAALALALASSGDTLLLAAALGLAAADWRAFAASGLAAVAVLGRWGTTSLAALAGGQSVLGPAGFTGSAPAVASAWLAAAALVLVAAGRRPLLLAVPLGLFAGLVVAGPAATTVDAAAVRAAAAVVGVVAVTTVARYVPARAGGVTALLLGAGAAGVGLMT